MPPLRLTIPLAAVAVAAVAAGAWFLTRTTTLRPASYAYEPTSALYTPIDTRTKDAAPLTTAEIFKDPAVGGLQRGATEELTDCDEALSGVEATGCTQALRGTYTSPQVTGEFVIFNLADARAADALVAAMRTSGFVRQATPFDATRSRAQARALGHFVTVTWVGATQQGGNTPDLIPPLVALDSLGHTLQSRVISAT